VKEASDVPPDTTPAARWTVVLAVLTGLAVAVWIYRANPSAGDTAAGYTNSVAGPVSPADRAMLVAVRQAALWEVPAVQQARQAAADPKVRDLSGDMADQLAMLSGQVQQVALRLNVALPNQPTTQQQMWANDISGERGERYDREMVGYLYRSCEATMATINTAREQTVNPDIRSLAQTAARVVGEHVRYLDQTGLVSHT
jgi:putative membrane protein